MTHQITLTLLKQENFENYRAVVPRDQNWETWTYYGLLCHFRKESKFDIHLTIHINSLLTGEKYSSVELPQNELLLPRLKDVLHLPAVVEVGAVEADAV